VLLVVPLSIVPFLFLAQQEFPKSLILFSADADATQEQMCFYLQETQESDLGPSAKTCLALST
jgi:hypothetical protein